MGRTLAFTVFVDKNKINSGRINNVVIIFCYLTIILSRRQLDHAPLGVPNNINELRKTILGKLKSKSLIFVERLFLLTVLRCFLCSLFSVT